MTRSPFIYSHPLVYGAVMRALYGRHFRDRSIALAAEVPAGASVVEVCAGDCRLYSRFLKQKGVQYRGLDISAPFVAHAKARGIDACIFDLWRDDVPPADVVVLQGSLYQFWSKASEIVTKLRQAAGQKLIVAESVRNLSDSPLRLVAGLSRRLTSVGGDSEHNAGTQPARFDQESLSKLFESIVGLERIFTIPGGREMVGIFHGAARTHHD